MWRGTIGIIIIIAPVKIPADPNPAIARPVMKTSEVGAAAQTADPTSKMKMTIKNVLVDVRSVPPQNHAKLFTYHFVS